MRKIVEVELQRLTEKERAADHGDKWTYRRSKVLLQENLRYYERYRQKIMQRINGKG
jgi:hypothetical protein